MSAAILDHLWQSTLCVGVAALLAWMCGKAGAHVRHGIWLVASLKFLVPFSLLAALGSYIGWPAAVHSMAAYVDAVQSVAAPASSSASASGAATQVVTYLSAPTSMELFTYLLIAWALGSTALAVRWLTRWNAARTIVSAATAVACDAPMPVRITEARIEPGVFGILRPVLLLPATIFKSLRPEQLRALVAHEAAHVKRHDNLTAAAHALIEVLFWFHPLVWWLGARLVAERERACDEAVIRAGEDRHTYAQAILSVCRLYLGAPIASASGASGGPLKSRIEAIVGEPLSVPLGAARRGMLAMTATIALAGPIALGIATSAGAEADDAHAAGDAADAPLARFSAAQILRGENSGRSTVDELSNRFVATNFTARQLVQFAYDALPSQMSGGPGWLDTNRYTIRAEVAPSEANDGKSFHQQMQERVKSLLANRFQLRTHVTSEPVYILESANDAPDQAQRPIEKGIGLIEHRGDNIRFHGASSASIVYALSTHLSHQVLDHTKAGVTYDFQGKWSHDVQALGDELHAQAGLVLKSFSLQRLVIDGAVRPTLDGATRSQEQIAAR